MHGAEPGQRVTACPWPTEGGEGTWQQMAVVPAKSLVRGLSILLFVQAALGVKPACWPSNQSTPGPTDQTLLPALARVYQHLGLYNVLKQGC